MNDRDVVREVVSGGVAVPSAVDARVRAALAAAAAQPADGNGAGSRRSAAALLLAGALVVGGVFWLQRSGESAAVPASPSVPAPQDPAPAPATPPQEPAKARAVGALPSAPAVARDLAEELASVPLLLVVEVPKAGDPAAVDGAVGVVRQVLQGDAGMVGKRIWLSWQRTRTWLPFAEQNTPLTLSDLSQPESVRMVGGAASKPWLLALQPMLPAAVGDAGPTQQAELRDVAAKLPWLQSSMRPVGGLPGTKVTDRGALGGSDGLARLRSLLLAGARDADEGVRIAAAEAMACSGDAAFATALLAMVDDPLPEVREAIAGMTLPEALRDRFLLDPVAVVRGRAAAGRGLSAPAEALGGDAMWCDCSRPSRWRFWDGRIQQKAQDEGIVGRAGAYLRQLHGKTADVNHMFGALGLGRLGDAKYLPELVALEGHDSAVVRAAAAWGRVQLGDEAGYSLLQAVATGDSVPGALAAIDALRALGTARAVEPLLAASRSTTVCVRALAAAGLAAFRNDPNVQARLAELARDPEELVQIGSRRE